MNEITSKLPATSRPSPLTCSEVRLKESFLRLITEFELIFNCTGEFGIFFPEKTAFKEIGSKLITLALPLILVLMLNDFKTSATSLCPNAVNNDLGFLLIISILPCMLPLRF